MQANLRDVSLVDTRSTSQAPDTLFTDERDAQPEQTEDERSLGFTDQDQLTISSIDKSEELQRLLEMKNKRLAQDAKLEAARQRREQQLRLKSHERLHINRAKDRVSLEQQQLRWLEDLAAEQDSHRVRDKSADHALLRKVYTGLVKRMHEWDLEEARLKREREALHRDDLADRVHALESILAERKETYQARDMARREEERRSLLAHRQMMGDLRRSLDDRFTQFQHDYLRKRGATHDREVNTNLCIYSIFVYEFMLLHEYI